MCAICVYWLYMCYWLYIFNNAHHSHTLSTIAYHSHNLSHEFNTNNNIHIMHYNRTMFGYQAENRGVGITGGVDFVELDGPTVVLHLKGRFWHQRPTVLQRVGSYLTARIPEIVDVVVEDEWELTDEANDLAI